MRINFLKKLRKFLKKTFFFEILSNFFFKPKTSFSENFGEDLFVENYFKEKSYGIYVDVGCNQPVKNSLTYKLHKKGWKGINIDISSRCIDLHNFYRNSAINYNLAVGSEKKKINAYFFFNNFSMNTVDGKFKNYAEKSVRKKSSIKIIQQLCLDEVLKKNYISKIDYLNIDVEGHEIEVLKGFDVSKYKPSLVSIEIHDEKCPPDDNDIFKYFIKNKFLLTSIYGYTYFFELNRNKNIHFNI